MKVELKKTKISLSEVPKVNVPGALLIIGKNFEPVYTDVIEGKQTYRLPNGLTDKDIASIYLRIM